MDRISSFLQRHINKILDNHSGRYIQVEIDIYNDEDTYRNIIRPTVVDKITIEQSFREKIFDTILVYAKFLANDVYEILRNIEGLKCRLTISYLNMDTLEKDYSIPYYIKEYNLHIPNIDDIDKVLPEYLINPKVKSLEQHHSTNIPLVLQLIPIQEYTLRKKRVNMMFQRTSIKDVVLYTCNTLGFNNVYYEDDINTTVFQNVYIPPLYGKLNNIFEYLHQRYGIYPNGLSYYYWNGRFYIYQPFYVDYVVQNIKLPMIKIYKLEPKGYLGNTDTFKDEHRILKIISNNNTLYQNVSTIGLENYGNMEMFLKSDNILRNVEVNDDSIKITPNINSIGINNDINRISKNSLLVNMSEPSVNVMYKNSKMSEMITELVGIEWSYPKIFSVIPGSFVQFIYEKGNQPVYQQGRVESIVYNISRYVQTTTTKDIFIATSRISLRLKTAYEKIS